LAGGASDAIYVTIEIDVLEVGYAGPFGYARPW